MQLRTAILTGFLLLSVTSVGLAQSVDKKVRIGILIGDVPAPHEELALLDGLRELGFDEGRNLIVERRYADGHVELVAGYCE